MNTRMELWKNYRKDIESNIALQKAVRYSDEKLKILRERLLKVFPSYDKKYSSQLSVISSNVLDLSKMPELRLNYTESIIEEINSLVVNSASDFKIIDEMDFSSKELNNVMESIQKGKIRQLDYLTDENTIRNIQTLKTKIISLGGTMKKIKIAIDGPSGSGKSTVAKLLAKKLHLFYVNTGLVYRAIAFKALQNDIDINSLEQLKSILIPGMITLLENEVVLLEGEDISKAVRSDKISQFASKLAAIPVVREFASSFQKSLAQKEGVIMDGRDVTFNIMPDADLKIFLDTSPEVRAQRRVHQNKILGFNTNYDDILKEIKERDHRDRNREVDPLHVAEGVHLIDASNFTLEEVIDKIQKLIKDNISLESQE